LREGADYKEVSQKCQVPGCHIFTNENSKYCVGHKDYDPVNEPPHYKDCKYQPILIIEDWNLGPHEANAVKYIKRAPHNGKEIEDLNKAIWYLNRKVELLEGKHG